MGVHQLPRPVEARNPKLPIKCRETHGLPRTHSESQCWYTFAAAFAAMRPSRTLAIRWPAAMPLIIARSTPFDDSGSSRQAASPTMNQAGCAGCAAMRQVTSAPLDCPIGVSLRKLTGTQLGGGREPSAATRVHPLPTSRAARRPVRSACRVTERFASFTCWQTAAQLPRRTYARFDVPLS